MVITSLRGTDSTGIAALTGPGDKPKIVKAVGDPFTLIHNEGWLKMSDFLEKKTKAVFGHGRAATKGNITSKNAHPFIHEHITLVHNGTIHYGLEDHDKDVDVDSHALCIAIAKEGLKKALRSITWGAYALIVHDAKEKCVYVIRNEERPLHRLVLPNKHILMSESSALKFLDARNKLTFSTEPVVEYFPPGVIFKYDMETCTWDTDEELKKEKETKKYSPPAIVTKPLSKNSGTDVYVNGGIELMLVTIEPGTNRAFHYKFTDDFGQEYVAISNQHKPELLGEVCTSRSYKAVKEKGFDFKFVKFRELKWMSEGPTDQDTIETQNGKKMLFETFKNIIKKEDCSICQGSVTEDEYAETLVTDNSAVICKQCIKEGKHHSYGFGQ